MPVRIRPWTGIQVLNRLMSVPMARPRTRRSDSGLEFVSRAITHGLTEARIKTAISEVDRCDLGPAPNAPLESSRLASYRRVGAMPSHATNRPDANAALHCFFSGANGELLDLLLTLRIVRGR